MELAVFTGRASGTVLQGACLPVSFCGCHDQRNCNLLLCCSGGLRGAGSVDGECLGRSVAVNFMAAHLG